MHSIQEESRPVGIVKALYRYPVKSMRGEQIPESRVGWHGFDGDRRYAFVQSKNSGDFPWLTARQIPALLRYTPYFADPEHPAASAVRVKTPEGSDLALESDELREELATRHSAAFHLLHSMLGLFDDLSLSLISVATLRSLGEHVGLELDPRRFRPNIFIETFDPQPYIEDSWIGSSLIFGDRSDSTRIRADAQDMRCMMITLDPETTERKPTILKALSATRQSCAGIYGTPQLLGTIKVGDTVRLVES